MPPEVEDCQRRIEALTVEQEIIGREEAIGIDVGRRAAQVQALLAEANAQREALDARWKEEKGLVDRLLELRGRLREGNKPVDELPPPLGEGAMRRGARCWPSCTSCRARSRSCRAKRR
jgi:type VI secretion system protein VasG